MSVVFNWLMISVKAQNAFSNDINYYLFNSWMGGKTPVLAAKIDCSGHQRKGLCYGFKRVASFAVCYNTTSLIPDMSGYSVYKPPPAGGRDEWRDEDGPYGTYRLF